MKRVASLLLVVWLLGISHSTKAAVFSVSDAAELIAAIDAANINGSDDVITLTADITLTAANNTIDGANGLPVIVADGGSSLTIEGGGFAIQRDGGAAGFRLMYIDAGANVFLNDLVMRNGLANAGGFGSLAGAIYTEGTLTIDNSTFIGNSATEGGLGGAIYINNAPFTLTNSRFLGNTATGSGGALYNYQNTATISGNLFSGNTGSTGGAIFDENSTTTLINNTLSGNIATTIGGGGIYRLGGSSVMSNNTVTGNSTTGNGGGLYNLIAIITLHNNIIAGNSAFNGVECFNDTNLPGSVINANSYNLFGAAGNAGGCPAGAADIVPAGGIGTVIAPLADNGGPTQTHALIATSPALDAANLANCPSADQRGFLRGFDADSVLDSPEFGDCDIGAFELSLVPAYDSTPAVSASIDVGATLIGTQTSAVLSILEVGSAALLVDLDSISGAHAADFSIIGLSTVIGNGNPPQDVAIVCAPSAAGIRTARATFTTNDPAQPTVSYDLTCTGIGTVTAEASFAANSTIINEDAGTLTIDVQVFIPAGFTASGDITLTISDALIGSAASGTDYGPFAPITLTFVDAPFVPGSTYTQSVNVPILDDDIEEGIETFELAITASSGPVVLVPPAAFTAIINDDEVTSIIVTPPAPNPGGGGGGGTASGEPDYLLKTVDKPLATAGDTVTYTIRARNPKSIPLTQVVIYDVFDRRLTDVRLISTTHGAATFSGNTLAVGGFSLQPDEEAVIIVSARVGSLRAGEVIPNAAILESPDASVHVSNLALIGEIPLANDGGAAQVFVIPGQLPDTGESPVWRRDLLRVLGQAVSAGGLWLNLR